MAHIFAFKGVVGIDGFAGGKAIVDGQTQLTLENLTPALENNPLAEGQIGFVCDISKCTFTDDAVAVLKSIKKSGDAIGDVDMFKANDKSIFAWMGSPISMINPETAEGSSTYDTSLLNSVTIDNTMEIPEGFKKAVEGIQ